MGFQWEDGLGGKYQMYLFKNCIRPANIYNIFAQHILARESTLRPKCVCHLFLITRKTCSQELADICRDILNGRSALLSSGSVLFYCISRLIGGNKSPGTTPRFSP